MNKERVEFLLNAISQKDKEAFGELFEFFYPKLIQIALAFVPSILDAEDIVSEVFYKLLKNPKLFKKVSNFDNYIFLSIRNQAFTFLKRNKKRLLHDSIEDKNDYILSDYRNPENSFISSELYILVSNSIEKLPPKRKIIFKLVKEEGKKYREVAEILNISVKTVELQMSLALKKIREVLHLYDQSKDIKVKAIRSNKLRRLSFSIFI